MRKVQIHRLKIYVPIPVSVSVSVQISVISEVSILVIFGLVVAAKEPYLIKTLSLAHITFQTSISLSTYKQMNDNSFTLLDT